MKKFILTTTALMALSTAPSLAYINDGHDTPIFGQTIVNQGSASDNTIRGVYNPVGAPDFTAADVDSLVILNGHRYRVRSVVPQPVTTVYPDAYEVRLDPERFTSFHMPAQAPAGPEAPVGLETFDAIDNDGDMIRFQHLTHAELEPNENVIPNAVRLGWLNGGRLLQGDITQRGVYWDAETVSLPLDNRRVIRVVEYTATGVTAPITQQPAGPISDVRMFLGSGTAPGYTWDEYRGPLPEHAQPITNWDQVDDEGVYHLMGQESQHRVYDAVTPAPALTPYNAADLLEQVGYAWESLDSDPIDYDEAIAVSAGDIRTIFDENGNARGLLNTNAQIDVAILAHAAATFGAPVVTPPVVEPMPEPMPPVVEPMPEPEVPAVDPEDTVSDPDFTEVEGSRTGGVVTIVEGEEQYDTTSKSKYVNFYRVDLKAVTAVTATFARTLEYTVNGDRDADTPESLQERETETRIVVRAINGEEVRVSLGSRINPAYLAAKRALEKEIHDGFESGEKLKGTFGPHDVEVTVNLDIGGIQAAKKFETTHSNLSHDLSAHATPRVGLFGIGKGNYIGYHAGVELGASVQKQGSDAKVTVGYDSGDHFHVQGSHNGFSGAGGNGQTDDALFAEASAPVDDFTTAKVRVDSEGRESVTLQDERGYSLGLARGTDGHTSITAGYKLKF